MNARPCLILLISALVFQAQAQEYSAQQLLAGVKAARSEGGLYARLRMEHRASAAARPVVLQVQVKRRVVGPGRSEHLFQILFPSDRKGEGALLRLQSGRFTGATYTAAAGIRPLQPSSRSSGLFGTTMTIDDVIAEFLDWPQQEIIGSESLGNIPCHIVESTAPAGSASISRRVRSWIDARRFVTHRIELFGASGSTPVKTIVTDKVVRGSTGYYLPSSFTVTDSASGAVTRVEGSRSDSGIAYTDADFADSALQNLSGPPSSH